MSERDVGQLHSADDLIAAVEQYGFLPFFRNEIHGFSVEELCLPELWFADDVYRYLRHQRDGPLLSPRLGSEGLSTPRSRSFLSRRQDPVRGIQVSWHQGYRLQPAS